MGLSQDELLTRLFEVMRGIGGRLRPSQIARAMVGIDADAPPSHGLSRLASKITGAIRSDLEANGRTSRFRQYRRGVRTPVFPEAPVRQSLTVHGESPYGLHRAGNILEYPRLRFSSERLIVISAAELERPFTELDFSVRTVNVFSTLGIVTLRDFLDFCAKGFKSLRNFGRKSHGEVVDTLLALSASVTGDGGVDWVAYSSLRGRVPLPEGQEAPAEARYNLKYPRIRHSSPALRSLNGKARGLNVGNLHLEHRPADLMEKLGVFTLGEFTDLMAAGIGKQKNMGEGAHTNIVESLLALEKSISPDGTPDWLEYARLRGFLVLPKEPLSSPAAVLAALPLAIAEAIAHAHGQNYREVLERRIIAPPSEKLTLEELSRLFADDHEAEGGRTSGRTRERARQVESLIIAEIVGIFGGEGGNYRKCNYRFRPEFHDLIRRARRSMVEGAVRIWKKNQFVQHLAESLVGEEEVSDGENGGEELIESVDESLGMLSLLLGFEVVALDEPTLEHLVFTGGYPPEDVDKVAGLVFSAYEALFYSQDAGGMDAAEYIKFLDDDDADRLLGGDPDRIFYLCSACYLDGDGRWQLRPEFARRPNKGRLTCDRAEEILLENGTWMHNSDLLRAFKLRYPDFLEKDRHLFARMAYDGRFSPIRKSGYWALNAWNPDLRPVREIVEDVVRASPEPMHCNEVAAKVREITPCKADTVRAYLTDDPEKYIKLRLNIFGLRERYPKRNDTDEA